MICKTKFHSSSMAGRFFFLSFSYLELLDIVIVWWPGRLVSYKQLFTQKDSFITKILSKPRKELLNLKDLNVYFVCEIVSI